MSHSDADLHLLDENTFDDHLFACQQCGRQFRFENDLVAHKKLFCTEPPPAAIRPPLPKLPPLPPQMFHHIPPPHMPPQMMVPPPQPPRQVRPRLIDQEGWVENSPYLPKGWKMKTRPRPSQEGQVFSVFLSPDNKVFHSRKAVIEHMKVMGCYSQEDYDKVKEGAKPGPRKQKKRKNRFSFEGLIDKKRRSDLDPDFENSQDSFINSAKDESDKESEDDSDDENSDNEQEGNKKLFFHVYFYLTLVLYS